MYHPPYRDLTAIARRHSRRADEVDDLVQDALLEALRVGRADLDDPRTLRWLGGVIRNRARLLARTGARRQRREGQWVETRSAPDDHVEPAHLADIVAALPPSLRIVAMLLLTGHSRSEIAYLLALSGTALRQRLTGLRRALGARGIVLPPEAPGLSLDLAYGRIRDALLPMLVARGGAFASHDPDGHLFVVRRSQTPHPRQQEAGQHMEDLP